MELELKPRAVSTLITGNTCLDLDGDIVMVMMDLSESQGNSVVSVVYLSGILRGAAYDLEVIGLRPIFLKLVEV